MAVKPNDNDAVRVGALMYLAQLAQNYMADIASTCAQLVTGRESSSNKITTISAQSTDTEYPSAKAVYTLFNSITNANEVSY